MSAPARTSAQEVVAAPGTPDAVDAEAFITELEKVKQPTGQEDAW